MSKTVIINAVEANAGHPFKARLVAESKSEVLSWAKSHSGDRYICVVDQGSVQKAAFSELGFEVREIDGSMGLLCQTPEAVLNGLIGEKPLPGGHPKLDDCEETEVINLLELLPDVSPLDLIHAGDPDKCVVQNLLALVDDLSNQSCGKCVFCREGLGQMQMILKDITSGSGSAEDIQTLQELTGFLRTQVTCPFGPKAADAIAAALDAGMAEISAHINEKHCEKALCSGLTFYKILGAKCIGCGDCMDACPEDAILGKPKFIHVINEKDCTNCGACSEACDEGAVVRCSTLNKPVCPPRPVPVGMWKK